MRVFGPDGVERQPDVDGVYRLLDVETYVVESERELPVFSGVTRPISGAKGLTELKLLNYLGDGVLGPLRFRVTSPKLSSEERDDLLDDIVREASSLPFDINAPAGVAFELGSTGQEVPFHLLAWLRYLMRDGSDSISAHFLEIARQPHRRVETESFWQATWQASDIGASTLIGIVTRPERLVRLPDHHRLKQSAIAQSLHHRFPAEVVQRRRYEDFDTHENRLVKATLVRALEVVSKFLSYEFRDPTLASEIKAMADLLEWMLGHDFLSDVAALTHVPLQSTVLQRRAGYREFLAHYLALSSGTGVLDVETARALLDLKKVSLLYELWCFFAVRRCLVDLVGPPELVSVVRVSETSVSFAAGSKARWSSVESFAGALRLVYNPTYRQPESYSLEMRPDILLEVNGRRLALDAKFRFEDVTPEGATEPELAAKRDDFLKMHAYRDAIRGVVGAYALFPGTEAALYADSGGWGVGAVPLKPGGGDHDLRWLLALFLSESSAR